MIYINTDFCVPAIALNAVPLLVPAPGSLPSLRCSCKQLTCEVFSAIASRSFPFTGVAAMLIPGSKRLSNCSQCRHALPASVRSPYRYRRFHGG